MVNLIHRDLVQVHLSIVEICHQSSLLNNVVKFDPRVCKVVDISNHVLIFGKQKHGAMAEQNYKSNQLGLEFHVAWGTAQLDQSNIDVRVDFKTYDSHTVIDHLICGTSILLYVKYLITREEFHVPIYMPFNESNCLSEVAIDHVPEYQRLKQLSHVGLAKELNLCLKCFYCFLLLFDFIKEMSLTIVSAAHK